MDDKKVIEKIKDWLKDNIKVGDNNDLPNLIDDNKYLLKAINDWQKNDNKK
tara:strand:+ start:32 stop:184 length:153 start_codon:yes stop_codon:yes gene_type:complete